MDYEKKYNEALERASRIKDNNTVATPQEVAEHIFPELRESEDERMRELIIDRVRSAAQMTEGLRELLLTYLEKQKDHHYTKRNALFDKCVENCDPEVMKEVSDKVDEMLGKKQKSSVWNSPVMTNEMIMDEQKEQKPNIEICPHSIKSKSYLETGYPIEQKPAEWSEEDETALGDLLWCIEQARHSAKDENDMGNIWYAEKWLKERIKSLRSQPKQEWSEKDNEMFHCICAGLCHLRKLYEKNEDAVSDYNAMIEWFRNRFKSIRPSWKPSEEQMSMLLAVINDPNNSGAESCQIALRGIYEQLKKL